MQNCLFKLNVYLSCVSDTDKEKLCLGDNVDMGVGGGDIGPSAALTPAIWDKTIPYDGENFHLEYMDLEEFLMENGIPTLPDEDSQNGSITKKKKSVNVSPVALLPIQDLDKSEEEVVIVTNSDSDIICDVTAGEWRLEDIVNFVKQTNMKWTRPSTSVLNLALMP